MRKNVFLKATLRQPMRLLLLVLLIATVSFGFVARTVEYVVVRGRILEISQLFTNVGILNHRDGIIADVSEAAKIIENSPYVSFMDKRRGFEGTLVDMPNAYIEGSRYWRASNYYRALGNDISVRDYVELLPRLQPVEGFAGFVSGDSFFYAVVENYEFVADLPWFDPRFAHTSMNAPHVHVYVRVDEILQGYTERLYHGQLIRVRFDLLPDENGIIPSHHEAIEIGQRYFFHGTFYWVLGGLQSAIGTRRIITKMPNELGDSEQYFIPVAPGENIDIDSLGLRPALDFAQHAQSAVYLRTVRDMGFMLHGNYGTGIISLHEGRLLGREDYQYARPVVVVERDFAQRRQVSVGDTITVNVNAQQHLIYAPYYLTGNVDDHPWTVLIRSNPDIGVLSKPGGYPYIALELEVVGIFDTFRFRPLYTGWSSQNKFMFVPDSLLPAGWGIQSAFFGDISEGYSPAVWFSFTLYDQRDQNAFLWSTRDDLAALGFRASFVGTDGGSFWPAANAIIVSITLNMVMFSLLLFVVLTFTVALYIWQRNKEYAISRALGVSARRAYLRSVGTLMAFAMPAALAGCIAGWFSAMRLAEEAIAGFGDIIMDAFGGRFLLSFEREAFIETHVSAPDPSLLLLAVLAVAVVGFMFVFVTAGNWVLSKKSVLEVLRRAK